MRFLFFDRIEHFVSGKEATGIKNISGGEEFFLNHYTRVPILPEPLIIEALAQVGGWAISTSANYCYLAIMVMIDEVKFLKPVQPGDQLVLKIEITEMNDYGAAIRGIAFVKEDVVAHVDRIYYTLFNIPKEHRKRIREGYIFASGKYLLDLDNE